MRKGKQKRHIYLQNRPYLGRAIFFDGAMGGYALAPSLHRRGSVDAWTRLRRCIVGVSSTHGRGSVDALSRPRQRIVEGSSMQGLKMRDKSAALRAILYMEPRDALREAARRFARGHATHYEGPRDALRRSEVGVVFLVEGVAHRVAVGVFAAIVMAVAVVVLAEDGEQRYA